MPGIRICTIFFTVLSPILLSFINSLAYTQGSVIEKLQNSKESVVYIETQTVVAGKGPSSAARDPKTGRILVARKLRAARFKRIGTGAVIDHSGLIVTNAHTVKNAHQITITFNDRRKFEGKVVWNRMSEDLAFVQIESEEPTQYLEFADSNDAKLNDDVYMIGSSEFIKGTLTRGKVTGIGRRRKNRKEVSLIQTSIKVYYGDSGAPIFDKKGQLLGLISAIQTKRPYFSIAIPANKIKGYYQAYLKKAAR